MSPDGQVFVTDRKIRDGLSILYISGYTFFEASSTEGIRVVFSAKRRIYDDRKYRGVGRLLN